MTNEQELEIKKNLKVDKTSIIAYNDFSNVTKCRFSLDDLKILFYRV